MKKLTLLLITFFTSLTIFAGEVTEAEALQKAQQFMQGKLFQQKNLRRAPAIGGPQSFYVFNADQKGGFVIVSADDRTESILGYANRGTLDINRLPENAKKWLEGYAEQIKALGEDTEIKSAPRRVLGTPVAPLVTAHWNQGAPYNYMCPLDGEERSVTGCVATAMAQVMYYYKWPQDAMAAIPEYKTSSKKIFVEALPATTFKWDKMKDTYSRDETGEAADAVAELMRYCGQAVQMDYTKSESGANVSASTMITYFGYSKTAKDVCRNEYSTTEWEQMMYDELQKRRPILYSGGSGSSGHQFVIDGYDDKGFFHVNWGWGGSSDGYFVLSILNPSGKGIGGGISSNGYTMEQEAVIGLQRDQGEESIVGKVYCNFFIETSEFTRSSSSEDFSVDLKGSLAYFGDEDITVDQVWALYKDGEQIKMFDIQENVIVKHGGLRSYVNQTVTFGKDLTDGTYEIRQLYRKPETTKWEKCIHGWTSTMHASISGNTVTLLFADDVPNAIHVNNGTLTGDKKLGRPMKATINWTNNGFNNETRFYLWLSNKEAKYVGAVSSYLNSGQTGDVEINFAPTAAGAIKVTVTKGCQYNDETDKYSYKSDDVIWEENFTIETCTPQDLSVNIAVDGEKNGTIEGTTIDATLTFTNEGENAYNDNVIIRMVPIDDGGNYLEEWTEVIKPLSLAVGASGQVKVLFPDLVKGQKYRMVAYYYSADESGESSTVWAKSKTITVGTVLVPQQLEITTNVTNTTAGNYVEEPKILMDITLKNIGTNDYDDWIDVDVYCKNDEGGYDYLKERRFKAQVPAGETKTIKDFEIDGLEMGKTYKIALYYYSENKYEWAGWTKEYILGTAPSTFYLEATYSANPSIQSGDLDGDGNIDYYVNGDQTEITFTVTNTGNADFSGKLVIDYLGYKGNTVSYLQNDTEIDVNIAAGESKNVSGTISNVIGSYYDHYLVRLWYYDGEYHDLTETPKFIFNSTTPTFKLGATYSANPPIQCEDLDGDGNDDYYVDGNQTEVIFNVLNTGNADFSGKLVIDYVGYNINDDKITYIEDDSEIDIDIAAGESKTVRGTISYVNNSYYDYYYVRLWRHDGKYFLITATPPFVFKPSDGINGILTEPKKQSETIYDLKGRRLNGSRESLKSGVYILNGKKVLVK